jgi:peptide chain release factor 1
MTGDRINLTLCKLGFIMDGDLSELVQGLQAAHQAEQLAAMAESQ